VATGTVVGGTAVGGTSAGSTVVEGTVVEGTVIGGAATETDAEVVGGAPAAVTETAPARCVLLSAPAGPSPSSAAAVAAAAPTIRPTAIRRAERPNRPGAATR